MRQSAIAIALIILTGSLASGSACLANQDSARPEARTEGQTNSEFAKQLRSIDAEVSNLKSAFAVFWKLDPASATYLMKYQKEYSRIQDMATRLHSNVAGIEKTGTSEQLQSAKNMLARFTPRELSTYNAMTVRLSPDGTAKSSYAPVDNECAGNTDASRFLNGKCDRLIGVDSVKRPGHRVEPIGSFRHKSR